MTRKERAPYYTQAELAKLAGVGRSTVSQAIRRGRLATVLTVKGTPLVARQEGERWLNERCPPGRPQKGST